MTETALPDWAESWSRGKCELCGAQLVHVDCCCGGHLACSRTAAAIDKCPFESGEEE